jgi:murein DD-endopeptidase MepM/ murein hydrolase activator NlpD
VGEGRATGGQGPNRLIPLIILLLLVGLTVGAAIMMWNKRQVERRAAAILADLENTGGDDGADGESNDPNPGGLNLRWPLIAEISSPYGYRVHPISKERKLHNGIDIAAPYWKEVFAAGDGKVEWAGRKGGKGNTVIIRHNSKFQTYYCHLQKCKVKKGEEVLRGDLIGWVGSTGYSRGPHLHLELHKNGVPVDPAPYLPEPTEAMLKRLKEKGIETLSD